jgi:hypothetical protein
MLSYRKLTKPERAVWRAIDIGRGVDLRHDMRAATGLDNPATGADWEASRTVRAQLLIELLTDGSRPRPLRALRLRGARISGELDLEGAKLVRPLLLYKCYLENVVNLQEAQALSVRLPGCHIPGLHAQQLETRGDLDLSDGFTCLGEVNLAVAHVGGTLDCNGAKLINLHGAALNANGLRVEQVMSCDKGFLAEGKIDLLSAHIRGQLRFSGARLVKPSGIALQMSGVTVDGDLMACSGGFTAQGEVHAVGARIAGTVDFSGAQLEGGLYMPLAHVAGQLLFPGAKLARPGGVALYADGVTVGDMMACSDGFTAQGEVRAVGARIAGPLNFNEATLTNPEETALNLRQLTALDLNMEFHQQPAGGIDLSFARLGSLNDNASTWPRKGYLRLRGLVYDNLSAHPDVGVRDRLRWLRLDHAGYLPQPYDQLVAFYRQTGNQEAARRVAVAKLWNRQRTLNPLSRLWNWLLYITVGYGYRTWLAAVWLGLLLTIGTRLFAEAYPQHMRAIKSPSPSFNPLVYTLDVLLPIVNLGQQDAWIPEGSAQRWSWWLTGAGWLLTTAVVAGITSVLKKE